MYMVIDRRIISYLHVGRGGTKGGERGGGGRKERKADYGPFFPPFSLPSLPPPLPSDQTLFGAGFWRGASGVNGIDGMGLLCG